MGMSSSPRPENVPKLSLSRVPSIETITFTLETSVVGELSLHGNPVVATNGSLGCGEGVWEKDGE